MKSVSAETYKSIKDACLNFKQHMDYFRNNTEISNDSFIFPRLALIVSLCEQVTTHIHE